ncbi:MAG: class IV adenylate cyclase [Planctomycetes bacterium]|nr:class IV adenylate cyclase [Planctomycetota bacterium]
MFEVEQKFPVECLDEMCERLIALGGKLDDPLEQVDAYYRHPSRDFAQTDEALRIRRIGQRNLVTYKGPKIDSTTKTRREIELPLPPGNAGAAQFAELLTALGFTLVAEVHKVRRAVHLIWQARAVEAALDDVAGVGEFVELETSADEAELADAKACLASLAKELELTTTERRSYLEMLLGVG